MSVITPNVVAVKSAAVEFLRAKLDDSGMSQTELAKLAGLERSHISEMLAGRLTRFSLNRINRALAVFNAETETSYHFKPPSLDISGRRGQCLNEPDTMSARSRRRTVRLKVVSFSPLQFGAAGVRGSKDPSLCPICNRLWLEFR